MFPHTNVLHTFSVQRQVFLDPAVFSGIFLFSASANLFQLTRNFRYFQVQCEGGPLPTYEYFLDVIEEFPLILIFPSQSFH